MASRVEVPREVIREVPLLGATSLGSTVRAQFSALEKDIGGHPYHLLGLWVRLVVVLATVANDMGASCPGEKLYDALQQTRLAIGDHAFVRDMRGAVLKQIERALGLRSLTGAIASDLSDADATPTVTLDFYIPCALPKGPPGGELDGAIPLAILKDEDLSFMLPAANSIPHTGVSVTSVSSITCYARLVPLSKLRMPTAWTMRERRSTDLIFTEEGQGFWDVAGISMFSTERNTLDMSTFTGIRITIGSGQLRELTTTQLAIQHNIRQITADAAADTESISAPEVLYLVPPISTNPGRMMTRQPRGPLKLEITARPTSLTRTDLFYRARGVRSPAWYKTYRERIGAPQSGITATVMGSKKGHTPPELAPAFDAVLSWPGMPFEVPNANQ